LQQLPRYETSAWLLDAYAAGAQGGTGQSFNWDLAVAAKRFCRPLILAGGLTPENVEQAVHKVAPYAVDVSSGVESSPGRKDHEKVRRFVENTRAAAARLS
jgi:phosphoribosylanthranilate isomerase